MGTIYHRNPRMEQVDIAIYRATLLAKARRRVTEAEIKRGEALEKGEVEAIVREEWRRWENLVSPEETTAEEFVGDGERRGQKLESPELLRKLMERR